MEKICYINTKKEFRADSYNLKNKKKKGKINH